MMVRSAKSNFLYNTLYQVLGIVLSLATAPYLARVIGVEGVGTYAYAFAIAQFCTLAGKIGLRNYGVREIARVREDRDALSTLFSSLFGMQIVSTFFVTASYAVYVFGFAGDYRSVALVFLVWVAFSFLDIDWLWFGLEDFRRVAVRNICVRVATVMLVFVLVKGADDVPLYAAIMSAGYLAGYAIVWAGVPGKVTIVPRAMLRFSPHLKSCLLLLLPALAMSVYRTMDKVMLGSLGSAYDTGIYENGEKLVYCLSAVIASFGSVMLPKMSHLMDRGEEGRAKRYIDISMRLMAIMTSLMTFGLIATADSLVLLLFGAEFEESALVLKIAAPILLAMGCANVVRSQYVIPKKMDGVYVRSILIAAAINIVLNVVLIPRYGAEGAIASTVAAEFFVPLFQFACLRRILTIKDVLLPSLPYVVFGGASCACALGVQYVLGVSEFVFVPQAFVGLCCFALFAIPWAKYRDPMTWSCVDRLMRRRA